MTDAVAEVVTQVLHALDVETSRDYRAYLAWLGKGWDTRRNRHLYAVEVAKKETKR